ncbi:putative uridine kinase C227.14 [Mercurialis annua]|uniref:putative uridine kinase C227.14 n=1 Tax=Mercurialis annua TaxID=3986 RepID=UPI00215F8378|nr:putative uridine kinase C227.14 [Mercurialis annua]XP_050237513.1 putative uridine kinase C227.14 [Mercurialis annua]
MEVSFLSRAYLSSPSSTDLSIYSYKFSESVPLLKNSIRIPSRHQFLPSISLNKASPLFRGNSIKVLCSLKKDIPIVEASSMDEIYDALAERILPTAAAAYNPNKKHIVGLAGPPGSGKSTIASEVVRRVNKLWPQKASSFDSQVDPPDVATVLPMDGFHLYRSQLDAMENPEEAHARRGAPWTFAPNLLLQRLKQLRNEGSIYVPSFDHGVGDPVEDDIFVSLQHKVVIVEGNYLIMGEGEWNDVSSMFDEKWFVDVNLDTAMERVLKRHISTGKPPDVAKWRIAYNDRPNAELIIKSKNRADLIIKSINF